MHGILWYATTELQEKHELKMQGLRDHLELRRRTEIHEIEEVRDYHDDIIHTNYCILQLYCPHQRKNGQVNSLMKNHEKAFSDIKNYYNDITLNNLALINSLKVRHISIGPLHSLL